MQTRGIIFDLDGTLVDSFPGIHRSLVQAMEGVGVPPWDLEQTRRTVGRGAEHLVLTAVGPDKKDRALGLFKEDYRRTCRESTFLFPEVPPCLSALERAGYVLSVASNKPITFTRLILEHLEILDRFACVMGPERVQHPKPHPDMLRAVCKEIGLTPDACLYVGDMRLDEETASRAGVGCVLVATGADPREVLEREVSSPVLNRLDELPPFLARL